MLLLDAIITNTEFLIYGVGGMVSLLLLGITIATAIRVNKRDRYQKATFDILAKMAEKQGVQVEEIEKIKKQLYPG